jgi:hypothetical protein
MLNEALEGHVCRLSSFMAVAVAAGSLRCMQGVGQGFVNSPSNLPRNLKKWETGPSSVSTAVASMQILNFLIGGPVLLRAQQLRADGASDGDAGGVEPAVASKGRSYMRGPWSILPFIFSRTYICVIYACASCILQRTDWHLHRSRC